MNTSYSDKCRSSLIAWARWQESADADDKLPEADSVVRDALDHLWECGFCRRNLEAVGAELTLNDPKIREVRLQAAHRRWARASGRSEPIMPLNLQRFDPVSVEELVDRVLQRPKHF